MKGADRSFTISRSGISDKMRPTANAVQQNEAKDGHKQPHQPRDQRSAQHAAW